MTRIITEDFEELNIPDDLAEVELVYELDGNRAKYFIVNPDASDFADFLGMPENELDQNYIDLVEHDKFINYLYNKHQTEVLGNKNKYFEEEYYNEDFELVERKKKQRKHKAKVTYTSGMPFLNICHFNKNCCDKAPEDPNAGEDAADKFAGAVGGEGSASVGAGDMSVGEGTGDFGGGEGGAMGESLLKESSWTFETSHYEDGYVIDYRWNKGDTFEVFGGYKRDDGIVYTDYSNTFATKEAAKRAYDRLCKKHSAQSKQISSTKNENLEEDYGEDYPASFEKAFDEGTDEKLNDLISELNFNYDNFDESEKQDLYQVYAGIISKEDYLNHRKWAQEYNDTKLTEAHIDPADYWDEPWELAKIPDSVYTRDGINKADYVKRAWRAYYDRKNRTKTPEQLFDNPIALSKLPDEAFTKAGLDKKEYVSKAWKKYHERKAEETEFKMKELAKTAAYEHEYPELHLFDLLLDAGADVGWAHDIMAAHSAKEAERLHGVKRDNDRKTLGYSGWSVESGGAEDLGALDTQNLPQEKIDAYKKQYQELSGKNESLTEAKRYVRRYYLKPQNIFCSNKSEILKALIDHEDEDCTIYTLINLGDVKDVGKLNSKDIIYYYEDGILYDKNYVRIMDYDLSIKHEEERANINPETTSDAKFADVYDDRMTGATELEETINNYFTEDLNEAKEDKICCICGEPIEGYGNNPEPYEDYSYEKGDRCCDKCNMHFVLPARLEGIKK